MITFTFKSWPEAVVIIGLFSYAGYSIYKNFSFKEEQSVV